MREENGVSLSMCLFLTVNPEESDPSTTWDWPLQLSREFDFWYPKKLTKWGQHGRPLPYKNMRPLNSLKLCGLYLPCWQKSHNTFVNLVMASTLLSPHSFSSVPLFSFFSGDRFLSLFSHIRRDTFYFLHWLHSDIKKLKFTQYFI